MSKEINKNGFYSRYWGVEKNTHIPNVMVTTTKNQTCNVLRLRLNGAYDPKMKKEVEKIIEKVVIIMMRGKQDEIRVKMCGVITKPREDPG